MAEVTEKLAKLSGFSVGEEIVDEGLVVGEPEHPNKMPREDEVEDPPVDFDREDKEDGEKAQDNARHIKVQFEPNDIRFWFSQIEDEMFLSGVNSQWLKKSVLQRNLPNQQKEDVKAFLILPKSQAGAHIYLDIKNEIIRLYAPKEQDSYQKALQRTMVGLPSQLGEQIINDICTKNPKLVGCCCARATLAIWSMQLPISVRSHISNMEFSPTTYKAVFAAADNVFHSSKQVTIAVVAAAATPNLNETQPAFSAQNQPQVAAISGTGPPKKKKKNKKPQKGQDKKDRGPRHSSSPPDACCDRHYRHGPESWYCLAPTTCPWADKITARP